MWITFRKTRKRKNVEKYLTKNGLVKSYQWKNCEWKVMSIKIVWQEIIKNLENIENNT
jgi:hypothetical protein